MADRDAAFVGSIPEKYDCYLGPIYFHHYADDLAARLPVTPKMRVLEMACGTGILTERLVRRLGGQGTVVATDLNEPMIVYAQQKGFGDSGLEWRRADATKLPFEDTSFEAALCQFGLMFFRTRSLASVKPSGCSNLADTTCSAPGTASSTTRSGRSRTRRSPHFSLRTHPNFI